MITIMSAQDLKGKDSFTGSSDPYVVLSLNTVTKVKKVKRQEWKTAVKKRTLNPSWDEEFKFEISDYRKEIVEIKVYDYNKVRKKAFMGWISLPVIDIVKNNMALSGWHTLKDGHGKLDLKARYHHLGG